jgi:glycosyltransferase involved in cell wall biosynthesis
MKILNLFTYDYPTEGNDHFFIEDEIKMLSETFDYINIIPLKWDSKFKENYINKENLNYDFSLSQSLFKIKTIIKILFKIIFCKILWHEIFKIKKKKILKKISIILKERILAENTYLWVKNKKKEIPNKEIFYSYWSNHTLLSFYLLKKENIINKCFARTLGSDLNGFIPNDDFVAFKKLKFQMLDFLIILNEGQRKKLKTEKLINDDKVIKCYQGINLQIFKEKQKLDKKIHILSCGQLIYVKNTLQIVNFIQAFSKVAKDYEIIYTCIGSGPDFVNVKKAAELKLKHIKFNLIEKVPNLIDFLKKNQIDLYINLSRSEGMSFAVMEAMSFSIPIICSKIPGNTEIVNNSNGYVLHSYENEDVNNLIKNILDDLKSSNFNQKRTLTFKTIKEKIDRNIAIRDMRNLLSKKYLLD